MQQCHPVGGMPSAHKRGMQGTKSHTSETGGQQDCGEVRGLEQHPPQHSSKHRETHSLEVSITHQRQSVPHKAPEHPQE